MEKPFDHVDWSFSLSVMRKMGFGYLAGSSLTFLVDTALDILSTDK